MKFDVIIIGSGQAGVPLATRLAGRGKKVLVAERGRVAGTCINTGCTPTKMLIASARAAHVVRTSSRLGVRSQQPRVQLGAIVDRKNTLVGAWRDGTRQMLQSTPRVTLLEGHARFVGGHEVEIKGKRYTAKTIIINVGARPVTPPVPGLESVPWMDNSRLLDLRTLPKHLVVLGGGYIGCELGQAFRRLGSRVTLVDHNAHLLSREDADVSSALEAAFIQEGITLKLGADVAAVHRRGAGVGVKLKGAREINGSHLFVATGRRPNTDDLGCEAAGIARDARGFIVVGPRYQTRVKGVFAVGDCIGQPQFTHTSWDDHRLLFDHLAGRSTRARQSRLIPYTVFTDPQVASVGLTETEAKKRGIRVEVARMPFGDIARAAEVGETAGLMKALLDPKTERLLGATLVGAEAGELIHVFVTLMQARAKVSAIVDAEFIHPTFSEGLQALMMRFKRYALS